MNLSKIPFVKNLLRRLGVYKPSNLCDIQIDVFRHGGNVNGYPDFCDAYIKSANCKVGPWIIVLDGVDLDYIQEKYPGDVYEMALNYYF